MGDKVRTQKYLVKGERFIRSVWKATEETEETEEINTEETEETEEINNQTSDLHSA
jgi:hypothetical protein